MKNVKRNLKRKAKGIITIGSVAYCMNKYANTIETNPAIPYIPRIGINLVVVGAASTLMVYGVGNLLDPDECDLSDETENFENKERC